MSLESVGDLMKDLTTSMTAVVRTHGYRNYTWPTHGTKWYKTTCIKIEWGWVSFPACILVLSGIFLVLVHIKSRGVESEKLWKSSTLAILFCKLDDAVTASA
jgi:hypothetical protein